MSVSSSDRSETLDLRELVAEALHDFENKVGPRWHAYEGQSAEAYRDVWRGRADCVLEQVRMWMVMPSTLNRVMEAGNYEFAEERTEYPRNRLVGVSDEEARAEIRKLLRAAVGESSR